MNLLKFAHMNMLSCGSYCVNREARQHTISSLSKHTLLWTHAWAISGENSSNYSRASTDA